MPGSGAVHDNAADGEAAWWHQPWKAMADLAEAVDDLICSFDYMDTAMDNLVMFVFIWILFSIVLLGIAKWAYARYSKKTQEEKIEKKEEVVPKSAANEIISSADSVLATSAKVKSASFIYKPPPKPAGYVPPSPAAKRRMGRMSPGPEQLTTLKKHQSIIVPTCTGPDAPSVQWVNDLLTWLYNDLVIVNELVQQWIVSMNEFAKKSVEEQGIGVELVRALDCHPPSVSNVFSECDSKDDVTITCDCEATPAFQLKAFSQRGEKVEVSHYRVNVNKFRARLQVICITDKLTGELKCDGWPEVKVALAPVGPLRPNASENNLQQAISEIVVSALRSTQFAFNLSGYPTCPRLRRYADPGPRLPLHYDSMLTADGRQMYASSPSSMGPGGLLSDKRLLVKVVGAKNLGGKSGCVAPYCVVEVDEPPQKNQTAFKKDTTDPQWDEHFLFDLSPQTVELLFEVYDRTGPPSPGGVNNHRFLGLGLVGIDELLAAPSQRQQIALQGRPMENNDVSGVLTLQFLFIEGAEIPALGEQPLKIKESLRTVSPHGVTTTTKTIFKQNGHDSSQLTESALRELEMSPTSANAANKSTLIIHSVQREPRKYIKVEMTNSGRFVEVERESAEKDGATENSEGAKESEVVATATANQSPGKSVRIKENGGNTAQNGDGEQGDYVNHSEAESPPEPVPRKRRRDFFGTIKRRLGRSRTRGASMEPPNSDAQLRSVSAERNNHDKTLGTPSRGVYSAGASPAQSGDESRTSRSEMSGISTASARTFIHEASTLVLETIEAGIKKHYLVPLTVAQRSRWRRKGVKLHIFNEHTFIAKHLSGGTVCSVCDKTIARRLGKQGYECRDCGTKCHKHCHVAIRAPCPRSTVQHMELAYITSPYTDKNIRML